MRHYRRSILVALLAIPAACGGGGGGGSAPPPPPPLPTIAGPSSALPFLVRNFPAPLVNFQPGSATGAFTWTVTSGAPPPGMNLAANGAYSGTPTAVGDYAFEVTLTDANGNVSGDFTQSVYASTPETEPNGSSATANAMFPGVPATGTLPSNDQDFWSFSAQADDVLQIEIFGARADHASWDSNQTVPRVRLIDTDGASFLMGHDRSLTFVQDVATGWQWGTHDMDIHRFRVPATGTYYLRIEPDVASFPGGDYVVRVNDLNVAAVQDESESNDLPATATAIVPGVVSGFHADGDFDFYSFSVSGPTIVTFEVSSYRNGVSGIGGTPDDDYFDPQLVLVGPDQATVITGNDDVAFYDSKLSFLITTAETYYVLVYESDYQTAGDADYVLTFTATDASSPVVETESNEDASTANPISYGNVVSGFADLGLADVDFFSFTGTAGDMVRIYWGDFGTHQTAADFVDIFLMFDDANMVPQIYSFWGAVGENVIRAVLPASGTYYVRVTPYSGATVSTDYTFQVVLLKAGTFETEPNDTTAAANVLPGGGRVSGVIDTASDVDVLSFTAVQSEVVVFSIHAGPADFNVGSAAEMQNASYTGTDLLFPDLEIVASNGAVLATTFHFGAFCSGEGIADGAATAGIAFIAPSTGTFYVRISPADGIGSLESLYLLEKR